jgi:hypothetical protein
MGWKLSKMVIIFQQNKSMKDQREGGFLEILFQVDTFTRLPTLDSVQSLCDIFVVVVIRG